MVLVGDIPMSVDDSVIHGLGEHDAVIDWKGAKFAPFSRPLSKKEVKWKRKLSKICCSN